MGIGDKLREFVTGEGRKRGSLNSKYSQESCALCSKKGAEKKWAGQFWHKKCYRKMRGMAKGMF